MHDDRPAPRRCNLSGDVTKHTHIRDRAALRSDAIERVAIASLSFLLRKKKIKRLVQWLNLAVLLSDVFFFAFNSMQVQIFSSEKGGEKDDVNVNIIS